MEKVMTNKEKYSEFCKQTYVPIYSKPWWLDAICGPENWDVWICEQEGNMFAAMPYYMEKRGKYNYITKAPLTQNNGIIFKYHEGIKQSSKAAFETRIINEACEFLKSKVLDVYEQQYQQSFTNWSPFYWNGYDAILRYSYVFTSEELSDLENIWNGIDKKKRTRIKKGEKNGVIKKDLEPEKFYVEVEKIYDKQDLKCPFSKDLWLRLYEAVKAHNSGHIIYSENQEGTVLSAKFLVWDEKTMYALISGGDVALQHFETKSALDWYAICDAAQRGLNYDFEGSMIKRIAVVYQEFGVKPAPYYRIRKIFNPEILEMEHKQKLEKLIAEAKEG